MLVCIHDLTLERTTDVEEVFPDRFVEDKTAATPVRRWLVGDFTLAEIKRLDAGSWFDRKFAGMRVPTFQEAIDLVRGKAGLYPELKDPAFYRERRSVPKRCWPKLLKTNGLIADPRRPSSFSRSTRRPSSCWPSSSRRSRACSSSRRRRRHGWIQLTRSAKSPGGRPGSGRTRRSSRQGPR